MLAAALSARRCIPAAALVVSVGDNADTDRDNDRTNKTHIRFIREIL
jgi:hypothetical protein